MKNVFYGFLFLFAVSTVVKAQEYEVRPALGPFYLMQDYSTFSSKLVMDSLPYQNTSKEMTSIFGIGGNLPFNNFWGISGVVAGGQQKLVFQQKSNPAVTQKLEFFQLVVQAGLEAGYPIYTNYETQSLVQWVVFGSGIAGKVFLTQSKFKNNELWGYAWGSALRLGYGDWGFNAGIRSSYQVLNLPYQEDQPKADNYSYRQSWNSNFQPFIGFTRGLY